MYIHNLKRIVYVFNLGNTVLKNVLQSNITRLLRHAIIAQRISAGFPAAQALVQS